MADFNFKLDKKRFSKVVRDKVDEVLKDVRFLKDAGDQVAQDIRFQAGRGKVIQEDGRLRRNPRLAESTISKRERLAARGNATSPTYEGPEFSNLSMSGQLIKSIKVVKVDPKKRSFSVGALKGARRPYRGEGNYGTANEDVLGWMIEAGRVALNIRSTVKKRLGSLLKRYLRRRLR